MGLCASAIDSHSQKVVPQHHHTEEERQQKISAAEDDSSSHCIGCLNSFPKEELELSPCCQHEVCVDCKPKDGQLKCKACDHNEEAGKRLSLVNQGKAAKDIADAIEDYDPSMELPNAESGANDDDANDAKI